ncbi:hypothetical protein GCM10029992_64020 [Glycomyces albus]
MFALAPDHEGLVGRAVVDPGDGADLDAGDIDHAQADQLGVVVLVAGPRQVRGRQVDQEIHAAQRLGRLPAPHALEGEHRAPLVPAHGLGPQDPVAGPVLGAGLEPLFRLVGADVDDDLAAHPVRADDPADHDLFHTLFQRLIRSGTFTENAAPGRTPRPRDET